MPRQLMRVRVRVVLNPSARGEQAGRFRDHLARHCQLDSEWEIQSTTEPGGARELAADAARRNFDVVVAAGGDGTVNEVLNGIAEDVDCLSSVRLGVLPLGTINVFARELGLPLDWAQALAVIRRGNARTIDLPQVEFSANGGTQRRYFAQLAGAGFDARAVELVDWKQKKRIGFLAYVAAGFRALRVQQSKINVEGALQPVSGEQVLIGNGRFYGGPHVLFPGAKNVDGLLDVCVFPRITHGMILRWAWGLARGRLHQVGGAQHLQAESFVLTAASPTPLELDGEKVGELPARFSVGRQMLRVIS